MATPPLRRFRPLPWQAEALDAIIEGRGSLFGWKGGVGSGKSATMCAAVAACAQSRPGSQWILAMDTQPRLRLVHLPIMQDLDLDARWWPSTREWRFRNGSVIYMRHLDYSGSPMDAGSPIEGGNLSGVFVDEGQTVHPDYLKAATMRARTPSYRIDPDGSIHACPAVVVIGGLPVNPWWISLIQAQGGRTWTPKTKDNLRHLDPDYVARLVASLTERERRCLLDGEDMPVEGQVLYTYRADAYPNGSILRGHRINWASTRTLLTGDLGYGSPAFLLMAEVWPGTWCVVREWAPDRTTLPDLCELLSLDLCPRRDWTPDCGRIPYDTLVVDPAGDHTNDQTGHPDLELLARPQPRGLGMWPQVETVPERRGIPASVQRMNLSIEHRTLLFSGKLIDAGLSAPEGHRTLARAIAGYAWDPRNPIRPKKDGRHDHHIDALRYGHRYLMWDALPPDPLAGRRPTSVASQPSAPSSVLEHARDAR